MLENYKKALLTPRECDEKQPCFEHKTSCHGVGNSRFGLLDQKTGKPPTNFCCINIDCLWPNPPQDQAKCDYVFIQLPRENPQPREAHFYFVELKKGSNFDKAVKQVIQTIEDFKRRFKDCNATSELPKKQITGVVAGGASPRTTDTFQKAVDEFKKKHGQNLYKSSELRI